MVSDKNMRFYTNTLMILFILAILVRLYLKFAGYIFVVPVLDPILDIIWATILSVLNFISQITTLG